MSRIRNCLTVAAGAAAGLFLAALASSATANADTVPLNPGLPGVVEQVVASSATIPQQLLQTTTSALSGTSVAPAASPAQAPIATATFNVPPAAGAPAPGTQAAGLPGLSGFPANLTSVLPFPLPNFGPSTPTPTAVVPAAFAPSAPVTPMEVMLIPGLP
ncbi:hypothetical protein EHH44_01975 [Mycolicibacter terrae]|uniref:Uncharacterized protein n=2 Tax=Mycolicibacter TaxID=1073531 RepID=A0A1A2XJI7_MYCSD|nr:MULTISPECIES: hypothetical protein [Mycolicibacter]OBH15324.1 hypothetical protein A5694_09735 [Mycolicibacter sinensis]OBI25056.1 hypothetical protein A5710_10100 [Mycolicibacter sinensis]RRR48155.1 hypothetical protein EHH44_01975 [Mycolicibacter terrae]